MRKNRENEFWSKINKSREKLTKLLNVRMDYTKEFDIFSMVWGNKKIVSTVELNLIEEGDLRFDVTKDGLIVGFEIDNFSEVLKRFNCDKEVKNNGCVRSDRKANRKARKRKGR